MRNPAYPPSSLTFDWIMAILAALLMGGVIQDGWAHAHGLVDQSFLTPWHAIMYSCMVLNGIVLGVMGLRNLRRGLFVSTRIAVRLLDLADRGSSFLPPAASLI